MMGEKRGDEVDFENQVTMKTASTWHWWGSNSNSKLHARAKKVTVTKCNSDKTNLNKVKFGKGWVPNVFIPTSSISSCLVVRDGEAKGGEFPLLAVPNTLAFPLAVQAHVLVLTRVVPHCLLVLAAPSAPVSGTQVLRGLQVVLQHRALLVPLHAGTVHLVFTARKSRGLGNKSHLNTEHRWLCVFKLTSCHSQSQNRWWSLCPWWSAWVSRCTNAACRPQWRAAPRKKNEVSMEEKNLFPSGVFS